MRRNVIILIEQDHIARMVQVLKAINSLGFVATGVHDYGVITGTIEEDKLDELLEVEGVEQVERDKPTFIAPPDSPVQ